MIVMLRDALTASGFGPRRGFCRAGIRRWCEAHAIDYRAFVREGIDEAALRAIGDPLADAAIRSAHRRALAEHDHG